MSKIAAVSIYTPPHAISQKETEGFTKELFQDHYRDIDKLLTIFKNGQIEKRHFSVPLEWFTKNHTLKEKNDLYISFATQFGSEAIKSCLESSLFLKKKIPYEEIEALFFISSTGISTPSIEARIMNQLPFSAHTKRVPLWGLGCAGGAAGLARAHEYCTAFPQAKVLVLSVELCSLTFQRNDLSKSNVVGSSLFADGVACALVVGDLSEVAEFSHLPALPAVRDTQTTLMPHSEEVMGWDVQDDGLYVIFSKDIPSMISKWLKPNVETFLERNQVGLRDVNHFIAHPGGRKVLESYEKALSISTEMTNISREILRLFGNMSSATIFYVLQRFMERKLAQHVLGVMTALGPGFSSELLLLEWRLP